MAKKRVDERRNITITEVSRETGIPRKTLQAWADNRVQRFDVHVMDAICQYLDVEPGELFERVPDEN